jgi:hypothetical protein
VYVPLVNEQNSAPLIQELLELGYVIEHMGKNFGRDPVPGDIRRLARVQARRLLSQLPHKWEAGIVKTNKAVIDAYLSLMETYGHINKQASFLNESWTVDSKDLNVTYSPRPNGVVVAAVGNDPGVDVVSSKVDFAFRSLANRDTLAVLALKSGAPYLDCNSSTVDISLINETMAAGFDGMIRDSKDPEYRICGTSFAAPRVAWFLALEESMRIADFDESRWNVNLFLRLRAARPNDGNWQRLWFSPLKYLNPPTTLEKK